MPTGRVRHKRDYARLRRAMGAGHRPALSTQKPQHRAHHGARIERPPVRTARINDWCGWQDRAGAPLRTYGGTRFAPSALSGGNASRGRLMRDDEGHKVETAVEARAGFLDRPVLLVLCASLALGVVVLGAMWLGWFTPSA